MSDKGVLILPLDGIESDPFINEIADLTIERMVTQDKFIFEDGLDRIVHRMKNNLTEYSWAFYAEEVKQDLTHISNKIEEKIYPYLKPYMHNNFFEENNVLKIEVLKTQTLGIYYEPIGR